MPATPPVHALDPNREYRLEHGAVRLIETLFRPGDVVCLAWKVKGARGTLRMHHDYRTYEQLLAQHRAGRGILRHLSTLNDPRSPPSAAGPQTAALFDSRHRSDVYFCVNPLRELPEPDTGEPAFRRRRTHIAAVRTIGMDMDLGGAAGLARLAEDVADELLPPPQLVVQTSCGTLGQGDRRRHHQKIHLLWAVADASEHPDGFTVDEAEALIQRVAPRYGAAPEVRSGEHLLRVPGFLNCKPLSDRPDAIDSGPLGSPGREVQILDPAETGLYEPAERATLADFQPVLRRPLDPLDPLSAAPLPAVPVLSAPPPAEPLAEPSESSSSPSPAPSSKPRRARRPAGPPVLDEAERARYAERVARATRAHVREHGVLELDYAAPGATEAELALFAAARGGGPPSPLDAAIGRRLLRDEPDPPATPTPVASRTHPRPRLSIFSANL